MKSNSDAPAGSLTTAHQCQTCRSEGFEVSVLGEDRCTFCDGTFGGNPPDEEEVRDAIIRAVVKDFIQHKEDHPLDSMLRDRSLEAVVKWTAYFTLKKASAYKKI